ncbi:unnamed protein product [Pylaiella littoralis]
MELLGILTLAPLLPSSQPEPSPSTAGRSRGKPTTATHYTNHRSCFKRRPKLPCNFPRLTTMCICKQRSSSPRSKSTKTSNRIVNKSMPPPPPPPPSRRAASTITATDNGRTPTPTATINTGTNNAATTVVNEAFSAGQISAILDPFFRDTCLFLKQSSWPAQQRREAPATTSTATNDPATNVSDAHNEQQRLDAASFSGGAVEGSGDSSTSSNNSSGFSALEDFLGSSAWADTVQDMETEKNDMLRLDVRV